MVNIEMCDKMKSNYGCHGDESLHTYIHTYIMQYVSTTYVGLTQTSGGCHTNGAEKNAQKPTFCCLFPAENYIFGRFDSFSMLGSAEKASIDLLLAEIPKSQKSVKTVFHLFLLLLVKQASGRQSCRIRLNMAPICFLYPPQVPFEGLVEKRSMEGAFLALSKTNPLY